MVARIVYTNDNILKKYELNDINVYIIHTLWTTSLNHFNWKYISIIDKMYLRKKNIKLKKEKKVRIDNNKESFSTNMSQGESFNVLKDLIIGKSTNEFKTKLRFNPSKFSTDILKKYLVDLLQNVEADLLSGDIPESYSQDPNTATNYKVLKDLCNISLNEWKDKLVENNNKVEKFYLECDSMQQDSKEYYDNWKIIQNEIGGYEKQMGFFRLISEIVNELSSRSFVEVSYNKQDEPEQRKFIQNEHEMPIENDKRVESTREEDDEEEGIQMLNCEDIIVEIPITEDVKEDLGGTKCPEESIIKEHSYHPELASIFQNTINSETLYNPQSLDNEIDDMLLPHIMLVDD